MYRTKQQNLLYSYVKETGGQHFTAEDIYNHFAQKNISIGIATIYRQLEKMVAQGDIAKYFIDEKSAACFEYLDKDKDCHSDEHFHLKCEICGKLIHLESKELSSIKDILEKQGFYLNPYRTVFYGVCLDCREQTNLGEKRA